MSQGFAGRNLRLVPIAFFVVATCLGSESRAEILPDSGEFEGVYHRDRWGVGRFSYFLVAPELHKQLSPFEHKGIRLEVLDAFQPVNPGDAFIRKIGKIAELENSQVVPELRIRLMGRTSNPESQSVELTFFLMNESDEPIEISLQDLHVGIRTQDLRVPQTELSAEFPGYTTGQLRTKSSGVGPFNNHLSVSTGSIENGHHLRIGAREQFPIVIHCNLEIGQHEVSVSGQPFLNIESRSTLPRFVRWFKVDIGKEDIERNQSERPELKLADLQWSSAKNQWQRPCVKLSFIVNAPPGKSRAIVVCSDSNRSPLAGTLTTTTKAGDLVKVEVDPCYDCSNLGEPWELVRIPDKGIVTSLNVSLGMPGKPIELPKQVRLQLLTDQGLESFDLDVPPADKLAPAK